MDRSTFPRWLVAAGLLMLMGCGSSDDTDDPQNPDPKTVKSDEVKSEKQRVTTPQVATPDQQALVQGNGDFAFDLYAQVRGEPGNLFFSPHSISTALAMLHAGARGNTETQMAATLHYNLAQPQLHPAFNWLDLELESRGQGAKAADGEPFRLNVVNAIWGQQDYAFLPAYLDTLALNYGAGLRVLDFVTDAEAARQTINGWVADETEQRIEDLLPEGSVTGDTRLVLTNAIYFNAAWAEPFEESATRDAAFTKLDGSTIQVPTMLGKMPGRHLAGDAFKAAALPYDGQELSMLVIVPDDFAAFEGALTRQKIDEIVGGLQAGSELEVQLPKWEVTFELDLAGTLSQMGMSDAMSPGAADFSGIDGGRSLSVSGVFHKAFVKVNEAGTEAAAATGVVVGVTSVPQTVPFVVDRPFIYLIRDEATGAILFVGRVLDPLA